MEKTLTFTVTDALLSPLGFSVLSGAGLFGEVSGLDDPAIVHVHTTTTTTLNDNNGTLEIDLSAALSDSEYVDLSAPVFVCLADEDGSLIGDILTVNTSGSETDVKTLTISDAGDAQAGDAVFVDYYIKKTEAQVDELQIDMEHFAGYYYVEADTLFRRQSDGADLPAVLTFPNVKIQSNFTFSMASTGDPSTFDFTMDAFPGYTLFDKTHKVLCVMQVVNPDSDDSLNPGTTVMPHIDSENFNEG